MRTQVEDSRGAVRASASAALVLALALAGCASYKVAPGPTIADTSLPSGGTAFESAAKTFAADLHASSVEKPNGPNERSAAQKAFQSGLAMLDLQCDRYLDAVGNANQAASNERKQVGLVGGFASAIMGLTGSSAKEIAAVATSFSFAASSIDAYTTAYLFSDAASSIVKIVRESQEAWLSVVVTPANMARLTYADVVRLLTRYESLCRPAQIRALIDLSIAKGTVVADKTRPSDSDVVSVLAVLSTSVGQPISEADAIRLYAWYKFPPERNAGPKLASNEPVASLLKSGLTDAALERKLAQAFLSISIGDSPVPDRWAPGIQALRGVSSTPTPGTTPPGIAPVAPAPPLAPAPPSPAPNGPIKSPSLSIK